MKCPECAQGKENNCTGWVLDEEDNMTDCKTTNQTGTGAQE